MNQVASTTFVTVQNEFYNSGFNYLSDNSQTDRAKRWINQSYQEVCAMEAWPFLRTSNTGTCPMSLPTLNRILRVSDTTRIPDVRLVESDEDTLADISNDLTVTGTAAWYYLSYSAGAPTVNVFPVSTNTFEVVYYQNPVPLSGDSDVLIIPDQFIDVVVLGTMRRAYLDGTDTLSQYQMVKQEYADRLQFMRNQLMPRYSYQSTSAWPWASEDW